MLSQKINKIEIDNVYVDVSPHNYTNCTIDTIFFDNIQYNEFFEKFMLRNLPCIVKNVSHSWECTRNWIVNNAINCEYLVEKYGDILAPVTNCDKITIDSQCKVNMSVKDYIQYLTKAEKDQLLYLKDWHLRRIQPHNIFYEVPFIFGSDWLNEYAQDHKEDDFMFVYIGPKDSWSPLHSDVYCSYSWSVNIVGKKKWILFPPGEENKIRDKFGNLPLVFDQAKFKNIRYFEIIQDKGDAIFVPSGWHHQVQNLLETISINHNWINACNIELTWKALQECLLSVENEIKDLEDTPEYASQCQLVLKSLFGMDYKSFINLLCYIGGKRVKQLQGGERVGFDSFVLGINHIKLDINIIFKIMNSIRNNDNFFAKYLLTDIEQDFIINYNTIKKNKK